MRFFQSTKQNPSICSWAPRTPALVLNVTCYGPADEDPQKANMLRGWRVLDNFSRYQTSTWSSVAGYPTIPPLLHNTHPLTCTPRFLLYGLGIFPLLFFYHRSLGFGRKLAFVMNKIEKQKPKKEKEKNHLMWENVKSTLHFLKHYIFQWG